MLAGEHKTAKWKKASPVVYQCGYHPVWTPKHGYRILTGEIKEYVERRYGHYAGGRRQKEWK
jgi:REP element-mobilizing transposase RayT